MIEIRYLQAESGANKFGTCNCCGKSSSEDPLMISVKFSYYGHGTLIALCDDCKKKLMEALPPANTSEIPNSSDTISRQAAIDALHEYLIGKKCPDDGTLTARLIENNVINKLPPAQPERIRGRWVNGHCDKCNEHAPFWCMASTYHESNFCPNCGADMREEKDK